jgi:hypothetical protein
VKKSCRLNGRTSTAPISGFVGTYLARDAILALADQPCSILSLPRYQSPFKSSITSGEDKIIPILDKSYPV